MYFKVLNLVFVLLKYYYFKVIVYTGMQTATAVQLFYPDTERTIFFLCKKNDISKYVDLHRSHVGMPTTSSSTAVVNKFRMKYPPDTT